MDRKTHEFILVLGDVDVMSDELAERLYEAGCDDGSPHSRDGVAAIGFSREAPALEEAIRTAIVDVQKAGCRVARVESPEEHLLALINQELATAQPAQQRVTSHWFCGVTLRQGVR